MFANRYRNVNLLEGEHLKPEFVALNPTSAVPALTDGDFKVFDSAAIAIYLVEKYAKDDSLYPRDLIERTKVHETMFYVSSYLFAKLYEIFNAGFMGLETEIPVHKINAVERGFKTIEIFLTGNDYLTGEIMRLSDLSLWCLMECTVNFVPLDAGKYPKLASWFSRMRQLPYAELNKKGADEDYQVYRKMVDKALAEKRQ